MADFSISILLGAIDKVTQPLKKVTRSLNSLKSPIRKITRENKEMKKSFEDTFKSITSRALKLGTTFSKIGNWMSTRVTLPLTAFGTFSLKAAGDLNTAMANVSTLLSGSTESIGSRIKGMKKEVQNMAIEFGKSTDDMAGGLYQVISVFGDGAESMKLLSLNAKAATAGIATTKEAINLTSGVTKAYGDTTAEAVKHTSDLAFTTVRLGATTFPELAASIGKVAPLASKLNITQEEMFAGFAALTGVTGNTAEVSTQLAAVLTSLLKPSGKMPAAIKAINEKFGTMHKNSIEMTKKEGIVNTLRMLIDVVKGNEELFTEVLGGRKEALLAAFALTGAQHKDFISKQKEMVNAIGATDEAFKRQTEGIGKNAHTWKQFKSQFQVFRQSAGDILAPAFSSILEDMTPVLEGFRELSTGKQKTVISLLAIAAAIGPVSKALGTLSIVVGKLPFLFSIASNPIALAVLAIAGSITALYLAVRHFRNELKPFDKKWSTQTKEGVKESVAQAAARGQKLQATARMTEAGVAPMGTKPMSLGKGFKISEAEIKAMGGSVINKSETDINLKVTTDAGSSVTMEGVNRKKGDAKVNLSTDGYVGQNLGGIP